MAGFTPNEGEALVADVIYKRDLTDRAADLILGLFTNVAPDESMVMASITQPSGSGYAEKTLTDASWTGAADVRSYAQQTWTAGDTWTGGSGVQGYYIRTQGVTPRLLHIEIDTNGPYVLNINDTYKVTPNNTVA